MKKTITLLTILFGASIFAQNFTLDASAPFVGINDGSVHLVDVDGDGDLDFFEAGYDGANRIAELYTNNGSGSFTLIAGTPFTGVSGASAEFGDIDSDGDQDLILTGFSAGGRIAELYKNNGSGVFTLVAGTPFLPVDNGDVIIADLDGDGDLDVTISGYNTDAAARVAEVYVNDGTGVFTVLTVSPAFVATNEGDVDVADVDGDGDLDLLVTGTLAGSAGSNEVTNLYLNNGSGVFTIDVVASALFTNLRDSDAAFADIDGDGDQDLLINGRFGASTRIANLYTNNGSGVFTLVTGTPFVGGNAGTVDFFDADNDGDLDVLLTGYEEAAPNRNIRLYGNNGSGVFTEETSETAIGTNNADIAIGDVDGDGDKDYVLSGNEEGSGTPRIAKLYLNSGATLSVATLDILKGLQVYPNPTKGALNIFSREDKIVNMQLFDITGRNVMSSKESNMDISALPVGVYVIKLDFETTSIIKKIIKE